MGYFVLLGNIFLGIFQYQPLAFLTLKWILDLYKYSTAKL